MLLVIPRLAASPGSRKPTLIKVPAKGQEEERVPNSTLMEYRGAVVDGCEMSLLPTTTLESVSMLKKSRKVLSLLFFTHPPLLFLPLVLCSKDNAVLVAQNLRKLQSRLLASVNHIPSLAPPGGRLPNSIS